MRVFRLSAIVMGSLLLSTLPLAGCSAGGSSEEPEDTTPPEMPSGLEATSGDGEVVLEWKASGASDLGGYRVYRATTSISSVEGMTPASGSAPLPETTFTDAEVTNGTTYYYRVTAVDAAGNESDGSAEVTVTPFPTPPDRP